MGTALTIQAIVSGRLIEGTTRLQPYTWRKLYQIPGKALDDLGIDWAQGQDVGSAAFVGFPLDYRLQPNTHLSVHERGQRGILFHIVTTFRSEDPTGG